LLGLAKQGAKSVEVRPVGISKGLAMSGIINAIAERTGNDTVQFDFVLVAGHFLARDENIFTFFEGQSLKVLFLLISRRARLPGLCNLNTASWAWKSVVGMSYQEGFLLRRCHQRHIKDLHVGTGSTYGAA
jgi:hypothetical protein